MEHVEECETRSVAEESTAGKHLSFRLYGKSLDDFKDFSPQDIPSILESSRYQRDSSTVLYIHGHKQTVNEAGPRDVTSAYLESRPDVNILQLDWSHWGAQEYFAIAAPSTHAVGRAIGAAVVNLVGQGFLLSNLHVVGFSLGAHVAGSLGNYIQQHELHLPRLTALDPASPEYGLEGTLRTLCSNDAIFVDVIHTDSKWYGLKEVLGHVDFWPNGGAVQPGCSRGINTSVAEKYESHNRAWIYYAESLRHPQAFPARPAGSYVKFLKQEYTGAIAFMGAGCTTQVSGNYYLNTNSKPPFGMGNHGI